MSARHWLFGELPRNPRTISILQLAGDINDGPDQTAFHSWRRPGLQRAARNGAGSGKQNLPLDWAELQKTGARGCPARLLRGRDFGVEPMARSRCALSGIVGRRAHCRGRLLVDPTDDSAALRRSLGNRVAQRLARRTEDGRTRAGAGNISRYQSTWRFCRRRGRVSLHDGFAAHVQPRDQPPAFNANAGGAAHKVSWTPPPAPTPDSPEIVLTAQLFDGRWPLRQQRLAPGIARSDHEADLGQRGVDESGLRQEARRARPAISYRSPSTKRAAATEAGQARAGHRRTRLARSRRQFHHDSARLRPKNAGVRGSAICGRGAERKARHREQPASTATFSARQQIRISSPLTARRIESVQGDESWPARIHFRSRRITSALKAAVSCAKRRSSITARTMSS